MLSDPAGHSWSFIPGKWKLTCTRLRKKTCVWIFIAVLFVTGKNLGNNSNIFNGWVVTSGTSQIPNGIPKYFILYDPLNVTIWKGQNPSEGEQICGGQKFGASQGTEGLEGCALELRRTSRGEEAILACGGDQTHLHRWKHYVELNIQRHKRMYVKQPKFEYCQWVV